MGSGGTSGNVIDDSETFGLDNLKSEVVGGVRVTSLCDADMQ